MTFADAKQRFSNRAADYVRYRPGYPSELLDVLRKECDLRPGHVIADIGSGTGFLSELFLKNGNLVYEVYPGRVVVFITEGGPRDPRSVWGRLAAGGLEIQALPGRHTEIVFNEPHIQGLAKQLNACLDRAQATVCSGDRPALR